MKTINWRKIEGIFEKALACRPEERAELLARSCEQQPELRAQVESLLTLSRQADEFLQSPALVTISQMFGEDTFENNNKTALYQQESGHQKGSSVDGGNGKTDQIESIKKVMRLASSIHSESGNNIDKTLSLGVDTDKNIIDIPTRYSSQHDFPDTLVRKDGTLATENAGSLPRIVSDPHDFPIANWDRYEFVKFIGEGGMGRVFKARDPRLNRFVALKFIRGDDRELTERFFHEARSQAKIEHENICKVYEVGEVKGNPFIAMQFIEGCSLHQLKSKLTIEEKIKIAKDVAEALSCAHRGGLVHRDIKPANIMIEKNDDGLLRPYVMDFGLAREINAEGRTIPGMILGTPAYMSPEQARGDLAKIDRRSDIYSLGATLYDLLAGRPPFQAKSGMEIIFKVVDEDPQPLRKLAASIPLDLEIITMKCLEKEQISRYQSAKALADDLDRYLTGEPILARPASLLYRLSKKIAKNRALSAVVAASLILIIFLGISILRTELRAKRETALAQKFGQDIKDIELLMRIAYMSPLHDIHSERDKINGKIAAIRSEMDQLGSVAAGPGHYAVGRGYLTLHENEKAREELTQAEKLGYHTPESAFALGQVMGIAYQKAFEELLRMKNKELQEARRKEIETLYREPALQYLKQSQGINIDSPLYLEALIAFYDNRFDEALNKCRQSIQDCRWLYEAKKLEADIYVKQGSEKRLKGDYQGATADLQQAGAAYQEALAIAHSDAAVYIGEAGRLLQLMEVNKLLGQFDQESFDKEIQACDQAIKCDSEYGEAYNKRSRAYWYQGEYQMIHGGDPEKSLNTAIEMAQLAVKFNPQDIYAFDYMGTTYATWGVYQSNKGKDPHEKFALALASFQAGLQIDQNSFSLLNNQGVTYQSQGSYELEHSIDPLISLDKAIDSFQKSIISNSSNSYAFNNLGNAYRRKAEYQMKHGHDAGQSLNRAVSSYMRSIEINPNNSYPFENLANSYKTLGDFMLLQGQDPVPMYDNAVENYRKAIQLNPNYTYAYMDLSTAYQVKAEYLLKQGKDALESLNDGRKTIAEALKLNANDYEIYLIQGQIELIDARRLSNSKEAQPLFASAKELFDRALQLNTNNAEVFQSLADYYYYKAQWLLKTGDKPDIKEIDAGLEMMEKALSIDENFTVAATQQVALILLKARLETGENRRADIARAQTQMEKTVKMNPMVKPDLDKLFAESRKYLPEISAH